MLLTVPMAARQTLVPWSDAPGLLALFGPPGSRAAAYRAYVTTLDLESVLTRLASNGTLLRPPGAWEPRALLPLDAFGQTGPYDRSALMRLYGAQRPRVARGPKAADGRVVESWTLISPYPDASLQRLEPGTLLIVHRVR